jgi:hypothetical protein
MDTTDTSGAAAPAEPPTELSKSEFAALNGWAKSYVSKLGNDGRLVLTADGKRVLVAESLARIAATTGAPERASAPVVNSALQDLQVQEKRLDVQRKQREEALELGKLLVATEVEAAISTVLSHLRATHENLGARLAVQIVGLQGNEARIRALIDQHLEAALSEVSRGLAKLAQAVPPATLTPAD